MFQGLWVVEGIADGVMLGIVIGMMVIGIVIERSVGVRAPLGVHQQVTEK